MKHHFYKTDSSTIVIPVPESYRDCLELINSDRFRISGRKSNSFRIVIGIIAHPFRSVLSWFRLAQYNNGCFYWLFRRIYNSLCARRNIYMPPEIRMGYGLMIGHNMSIVINEHTVIGNNINISQFVNIGTNHDSPAIIADNVYIGPNVSIVENVCIESNVTIGAGSVVTRNLPAYCTAAGVPARCLNFNNPARYINNRYPVRDFFAPRESK